MLYNFYFYVIFLFFAFILSSCQWFEKKDSSETSLFENNTEGISYEVTFNKNLRREIHSTSKDCSALLRLEKNIPSTIGGLIKRAEKDKEVFEKALASLGYFNGSVSFTVQEEFEPIQVEFKIKEGPRYTVNSITLICLDKGYNTDNHSTQVTSDIIGLQSNDYINLHKLHDGKEKIKKYFQNIGYPFAEVQEPEAIVDHESHTIQIIYRITTGYIARIIDTDIIGLKNLAKEFVENRIYWKKGEIYNQQNIDKTRRKLIETALLGKVSIEPRKYGEPSDVKKEQPIKMYMKTTESAPRTIGAGARYSSSEGIGGEAFWHHYNVRGHGEHFGIVLQTSKREGKSKIVYNIPDFLSPQQKLLNEISLVKERNRAYVGRTINIGTKVQRPFTEYITASIGAVDENGRFRRENTTYNTHLIGIPLEGIFNASNSLLDPTHGVKIDTKITPYFGKFDKSQNKMTVTQGSLTAYLPFFTNEIGESRGVLASFIKAGSISIKSLDIVPPNKRFYAGGGGSVRGYGYQLVGPLDSQAIPLGGRSLAEFGTEVRFKTTETIGFVTFLEAGSVTTDKMPKYYGKELMWGTGCGLRYYSSVGPIRVDLGFPLKRRHNPGSKKPIDAPFQLYISIGQAF